MTGLASCRSKPVQTIFETTQKDSAIGLKETEIYFLKKQTTNSDFNYSKLDYIDGNIKDTLNLKNLIPIFEPVSGQYNYYQFLATFKGVGYNGDAPPLIKDFHNILIIKTDKKNKIVDSYQYTLEWAEIPLQYDLFRSSVKNVILKNNLVINQLKFMRTYGWSDNNKELKENGMIKLQ